MGIRSNFDLRLPSSNFRLQEEEEEDEEEEEEEKEEEEEEEEDEEEEEKEVVPDNARRGTLNITLVGSGLSKTHTVRKEMQKRLQTWSGTFTALGSEGSGREGISTRETPLGVRQVHRTAG
jgi:hypothetical protein